MSDAGTGGDPRRSLPSVDRVLRLPAIAAALERHPRALVVEAVRSVLADRRGGPEPGVEGIEDEVLAVLRPTLRRVINATGVVLHTNLGRAPLADEAVAAAIGAAGFATVEFDLDEGRRGSRQSHVQTALRALTGADAGCVVNTNAGAVLLALVALGAGGEVIVSRGELVEIGGGFRVPEVLAASGCRLVEVGTTNKTRVDDYARAIGPATRAILRVHPSNYRVVGFTESTPLAQLVDLARRHGFPLIDDLGSGALDADPAFRGEPDVRGTVAAGADIVAFSGDKLLGGPQCGILVGRRALVDACAKHPLMRALRPDKITIAALDATLRLHLDPRTRRTIPAVAMLTAVPEVLRARADRLAAAAGGEVVPTVGRVGGGSLPTDEIASFAVALPAPDGAAACVERLRRLEPPVVVRIQDDRVLLDVLAISEGEVDELARLLGAGA